MAIVLSGYSSCPYQAFALLDHDGSTFRRSNLVVLSVHQLLEIDLAQILVDRLVQTVPQLVRQTGLAVLAVATGTAMRGIKTFIHCDDDIDHRNFARRTRQAVTAAGTAHAS